MNYEQMTQLVMEGQSSDDILTLLLEYGFTAGRLSRAEQSRKEQETSSSAPPARNIVQQPQSSGTDLFHALTFPKNRRITRTQANAFIKA